MDQSQALEGLASAINDLAERPYDIALHVRHIHLAQVVQGLEAELHSAQEMMTNFLAAGDEIWLPLISAKETSTNLTLAVEVEELLSLYERAESDYLSIPILKQHLEFIIGRHALYTSEEPKPEDFNELFTPEWTRAAIDAVVRKGVYHITQSHLLWDVQRDWEMELLASASELEKQTLVANLDRLYLFRLKQPHSNYDETFQSYSSFTTNYKQPQDYENLMVAASKLRSQAVKSYDRREISETYLVQSGFSLESYARYIAAERRARYPDMNIMGAVFERAITEAAKRRFSGEVGAEEALQSFWVGFLDALRINDAGHEVELETLQRAIRSIPGAGEVWARYLRYLERHEEPDQAPERISRAEVYERAWATNLLQSEVEQIIPLVLARAGYEKRLLESGKADEDAFGTLVKVLEDGIEMVRTASPVGDPRLRLEKYLTEIYLQLAGLPESAITIWELAAKHYKTSYLAWTSYTDALIKQDRHSRARGVFKDICMKLIDWPEAVWEAWISFEHLYGSVGELDECLDKVDKARYQVNSRRARDAQKELQIAAEYQAAHVPVVEAIVNQTDETMDVDITSAPGNGSKRKAENDPTSESHKKAKTEQKPLPLKRDRENSTVFVADLPADVTDDDLIGIFKDCGKIREIKITPLLNAVVATVEFFERECVPAGLTKDKKRLREMEIAVHLAWKSTLYVTNFPEKTDDLAMRDLFGKYGIIFDVRWPSKKFKNTRRFCYIQYTSPAAAEKALELHGQEFEPGLTMNVFISNPERKKERTDQDANEREIYVAGLSKFTTKADLEKLFGTYGNLKEVRMATEKDGNSKGFAFIEFEQEKDALAALAANNHELKKRRIAVTVADSRVRARNRNIATDTGLSRRADIRSRSVRIHNLPTATQEGLLQQVFEKLAVVRRVEVFEDLNEAVVELENIAEAGKLLLRTDPILFGGNTLVISEEGQAGSTSRPQAPPPKTEGLFVPRLARSRPRAGLGHSRKPMTESSSKPSASNPMSSKPGQGKGQDDFRKMLG